MIRETKRQRQRYCGSRHCYGSSTLIALVDLYLCLLVSMSMSMDIVAAAAATESTSSTAAAPYSYNCQGRLALVTGGTGQTGRLVTTELLRAGFCVRILTRSVSKGENIFFQMLDIDDDNRRQQLEFVEGTLGDGISVPKAFESSQRFGVDTAVSHVVFIAGGEDADFDAVNHRGVAECAKQAAKAESESMVVVSAAWVSKPYSLASLLFNSLYDDLPMSKHLQGENVLREIGRKQHPSLNYVVLRAGRLVPDDEYPQDAADGLWIAQDDNFAFFGPAGNPGMSQTLLAKSVVTAMKVKGKYTVQITSGSSTLPDDVTIYSTLLQDSASSTLETPEEIDRWHQQAVTDFKVMFASICVGTLVLFVLLGRGWSKFFVLLSLLIVGASAWIWSVYWLNLSVASLVALSAKK